MPLHCPEKYPLSWDSPQSMPLLLGPFCTPQCRWSAFPQVPLESQPATLMSFQRLLKCNLYFNLSVPSPFLQLYLLERALLSSALLSKCSAVHPKNASSSASTPRKTTVLDLRANSLQQEMGPPLKALREATESCPCGGRTPPHLPSVWNAVLTLHCSAARVLFFKNHNVSSTSLPLCCLEQSWLFTLLVLSPSEGLPYALIGTENLKSKGRVE